MCWHRGKKSDIEKVWELIKNEKPDLGKLFSDISSRNEADKLYHKLVVKIHPDQYIPLGDEDRVRRATELFAKRQKVRTDLSQLKELGSIIESEF